MSAITIAHGIPATALGMWTEWHDPGAANFRKYAQHMEKSSKWHTNKTKSRFGWSLGAVWVGLESQPSAQLLFRMQKPFRGFPVGSDFPWMFRCLLHKVAVFRRCTQSIFCWFWNNLGYILENIWCVVWRRLDIMIFASAETKHCPFWESRASYFAPCLLFLDSWGIFNRDKNGRPPTKGCHTCPHSHATIEPPRHIAI